MASTPFPASATTCRSGSWLMMLATPVRSSAWSSTRSTRASPDAPDVESACNMDLRRQGRWFPCEHDFRAIAWRRHDRQRGTDTLGSLLHPNHPEPGVRRIPADAAAVVSDREAQPDRLHSRCANLDAARARGTNGIRQRLLRDRPDLAFDAVAEAGELVHDHVDRNVARALTKLGEAFQRRRDVLAAPDVGTKCPHRSSCLGQVSARQVDRRLDIEGDSRRHAAGLALGRLKLHQNRGEPLGQVVVDVACQTVTLFEDRFAALFTPVELDQAAVVQGESCLTRDGLDENHPPPPALGLRGARARYSHPAQMPAAQSQRCGDNLVPFHLMAELSKRFRQALVVALVFDRLSPALCVLEEVFGHVLAGEGGLGPFARFVHRATFRRHEESILHVGHPQLALLNALVDQPDGARVALALHDHRLAQRTEETFDVRLPHEQIKSMLDDLGLHVRTAFSAAAFARLANQRGAQHVWIARRPFFWL